MILTYENGELIVTHDSGVVDTYNLVALEDIKIIMVTQHNCCQSNIDCINEHIANAEGSMAVG